MLCKTDFYFKYACSFNQLLYFFFKVFYVEASNNISVKILLNDF